MGRRGVWLDAEAGAEIDNGALALARNMAGYAARQPVLELRSIRFYRRAVVRDRVNERSLVGKRAAAGEKHVGIARVEPDRIGIIVNRFVPIAPAFIKSGAIDVSGCAIISVRIRMIYDATRNRRAFCVWPGNLR